MIIGNGDIASVLPDRDDITFFASGVSNSQEKRDSEYEREKTLLLEQSRSKRLVYFSSLCIFYSNTRYAQHKLEMESLIKVNFPKYTIIRIGNIDWGINPNTIINYLRSAKKIIIQDVYRYIVSKDEFLHWIGMIPEFNCEMNIAGRRMKVEDIVKEYVK